MLYFNVAAIVVLAAVSVSLLLRFDAERFAAIVMCIVSVSAFIIVAAMVVIIGIVTASVVVILLLLFLLIAVCSCVSSSDSRSRVHVRSVRAPYTLTNLKELHHVQSSSVDDESVDECNDDESVDELLMSC